MERVGSALCDHVYYGASITTKFGVEVICDDSEFLRRVGIRAKHTTNNSRNRCVVVINTVQKKVVIALSRAVHRVAAQ